MQRSSSLGGLLPLPTSAMGSGPQWITGQRLASRVDVMVGQIGVVVVGDAVMLRGLGLARVEEDRLWVGDESN